MLPQTLSMAQRLAEHGVHTTVSVLPELDHEFFLMHPVAPRITAEWERVLGWLGDRAADAGFRSPRRASPDATAPTPSS